MKRLAAVLLTACLIAPFARASTAQAAEEFTSGTTYARITNDQIVLGNALVERTWRRAGFATLSIVDKRDGGLATTTSPDFRLIVGGSPAELTSDRFNVTSVAVEPIDGGLRASIQLSAPGITATRVAEVYDGIAGFRTQTTISPLSPLALRGYTLDEAAVGNDVAPTIHAFRAGADWREPDWGGPDLAIGDKHGGTWRDTKSGQPGQTLQGPAQWISTAKNGSSLFMVMERNDWPSSRASYSGGSQRLVIDYSADVIIAGPFEESIHAENPRAGEAPGRHRTILPTRPFVMESAFTGFGSSPDDEPWQFHKYLTTHRLDPYDKEVTFNSNGTDANVRSDGAKDDMVEEVIEQVAPKAHALGIETFILDDGWQARSGDWVPDCGTEPGGSDNDPRWDGTPATAKFGPRYTDCTFDRVKELIAPMELGLWMSPMHFHPRSAAYMNQPQWACKPVGDGVGAVSLVQPNGGSNDAGLGTWSVHPDLIDHIQSRIQTAIDDWGVTYFKFDFLVWLDCAGQNDLWEYKEAFMAMVDRLIAQNPAVTFQIDETNDYRLFPFESVNRGPSWFQNGSPPPDRLLHNLWNLSPYVPAYSLGQHFLGGNQYNNFSVDTLMPIALPGHLTFFSDLRNVPDAVVQQARPWIDFYTTHRSHFTQMTYPLLNDPIEKNWTALQTWNPEEAFGALLAFRQQATDATKTIALTNVPAGMTFDLFEGPTGAHFGTVTSEQLRAGIEVTIPNANGAQVLVIKPAAQDEFDPATTLIYDGDITAPVGGTLTLAARLSGTDGPIAGAPLTFSFRGDTLSATTDDSGRATVTVRALGPPGDYPVVVSYPGTDRYLGSTATQNITVGSRR